jgi:hypothetical protein
MSEGKINWKNWALGIGGTIVTGVVVWIGQFMMFGFDEYVKEVAATAQAVDSTQFQTVQTDIADIKATLEAEAQRDKEWREQQREDMRNLIKIISDND